MSLKCVLSAIHGRLPTLWRRPTSNFYLIHLPFYANNVCKTEQNANFQSVEDAPKKVLRMASRNPIIFHYIVNPTLFSFANHSSYYNNLIINIKKPQKILYTKSGPHLKLIIQKERLTYEGDIYISKLECAGHVQKWVSSNLRKLKAEIRN